MWHDTTQRQRQGRECINRSHWEAFHVNPSCFLMLFPCKEGNLQPNVKISENRKQSIAFLLGRAVKLLDTIVA